MKVSAFTFIKNGQILGYPFLQSIQSILPIVDEFIINVGESEDDTLTLVKSIVNSKIRIIKSVLQSVTKRYPRKAKIASCINFFFILKDAFAHLWDLCEMLDDDVPVHVPLRNASS